MSKNFKVNSEYLYSEGDIDSYVNSVIKYGFGGFKAEHRFLLNKKFGTANNPYYVLYSGAIDSAGKIPLDFFFDKTKQPTPVDRDDRKDVFDELMPVMLLEENCKAKILFPYNITNIHWLTGEIVVNKQGDNVSIEIYTHDPHGGGQLSWGNCKILSDSLKNSIEASGLQVTSVTAPKSPFTNARQSTMDETSCRVITANEVVKRITDHSLNISSPYPVGAEQLRLSQLTFLQEKLGEEDRVYQYFKKQVTVKETDSDLDDSPIVHHVQNVPVLTVGEIREKVELILGSEDITKIDKFDKLEQIEKEHYKPFIKQLAYKKTQEELKDLVEVLADLGYLTTKLGELSGELKYYTDAAVFYQYVITILNEQLTTESKNEFTRQELTNPYQQLTDIQELIFSTIGGDQEKMPVVSEEATSNKKILSKLRIRADLNMEMIEKNYRHQINADKQEEKQKYQELYVKTARELFEDTANGMRKFLAKLYSDSEKELTIPPPCKYAVIGLGSMALKQMTPYSDLEFAILTGNDYYKQSNDPKIKQYFKNLSHLVNFKISNLGETIIPTSKYGLDMSHLVHRGVNFDLGGKTPLGRIDKPYELIKTIDGMLCYVRNAGDKVSHIDKNLPYILEKVCYVYGNEQLVKSYKGKVTKFLHSKNENDPQGRLNCEIRTLKLLEEGAIEINYLQQTSSKKQKKGDLDELQLTYLTLKVGYLMLSRKYTDYLTVYYITLVCIMVLKEIVLGIQLINYGTKK
ncbi:MAG: hypothetical protein LN561_02065 [Rickettsia endosymbiont of Labidopullus appendiculatus]|nr:hypothetical protein [Rickettsia endosymbiont of Labidopullus appendiculatus]